MDKPSNAGMKDPRNREKHFPDKDLVAEKCREKFGSNVPHHVKKCMDQSNNYLSYQIVHNIINGKGASLEKIRTFAEGLGVGVEAIVLKREVGRLRPLRIGVLGTAGSSYLRDIEYGLRSQLDCEARKLGYDLEYYSATGPAKPFGVTSSDWARVAAGLLAQAAHPASFDYLVGLGTTACIALRNALGKEFGYLPFCFLGVTDPEAAGLVDTLDDRKDSRHVTGVYYGGNLREVVRRAREVFPARPIVFLYRRGIVYDEAAVGFLRKMRRFNDEAFDPIDIQGFSRWPRLSDINRESVYLSWYTLEHMADDHNLAIEAAKIFQERLVFATTRAHVRMNGGACAGASADDVKVGESGAKIILNDFKTRDHKNYCDFGQIRVIRPEVRLWLNPDNARHLNVRFGNELLRRDDVQVFGSVDGEL